ncbi:MAG TPA: RHS repeat-associated core domain-containing protein [Anaerolineales bacterium]|nr:RHS repeat-associated core domain-containing protein [Anaerolineales bacterium]
MDTWGSIPITLRKRRFFEWSLRAEPAGSLPTDRRYTGQIEEAELGIYFYNARWYDPWLGRFLQADTIVPEPLNPGRWDRYTYVQNNATNRVDPTGHKDICSVAGEGCGGSSVTKQSHIPTLSRLAWENALGENGWDLVPILSDIRLVIRGSQVANWASQQPGFLDQQVKLLDWQNNCYGLCHYASVIDLVPSNSYIGGPMPDVPLVDIYSTGCGDAATGLTSLFISGAILKSYSSQTQVFYKGGAEWHLGLETKGNMNIIHIGNHQVYGTHIAFGAIKPYIANLHLYAQKTFPFFRIWKP